MSEISSLMSGLDKISPYVSVLEGSSYEREWVDTGSMLLNALISGSLYGGVPNGRVIQFAGPSQTFKTGFILRILANAQKKGKHVVIVDTEGAIEEDDAAKVGLDTSKIVYIRPESCENARNLLYKLFQNIKENGLEGKVFIAVDSLANMQSEMELKRMENDNTSADMGTLAKAIKSFLKTATNGSSQTNTTVLVTNHIYDDPSAMYASIEKIISGGKAAIYLPSVTVQLARLAAKEGEIKGVDDKAAGGQKAYAGVKINVLTVKNRFIKQYLEGQLYLSFSTGLDKYHGLVDVMKALGVVVGKGATYEDWEGNKLGYYKAWRKKEDVWEKLLPELETRIKVAWAYSQEQKDVDDQIDADLDLDDVGED